MGSIEQVGIGGVNDHFILVQTCAKKAQCSLMSIQGMKESPDGQPLNIWVEYCAQCRGEHSIDWDGYEDLAFSACTSAAASSSRGDQAPMWLDTESGWNWQQDILEDGGDPNVAIKEIPRCLDDVAALIATELHHLALNYESPLIEWLTSGWEAYEAACSIQRQKEDWESG